MRLHLPVAVAMFAACTGKAAPPPVPDSGAVTTATISELAPPPSPADRLREQGLEYASITVRSSLEASVAATIDPTLAAPLTQVATRVLVWWANPSTDLRTGDVLEVVYKRRPGEEPEAHAVWFRSGKLGRAFSAVLYRPLGSQFARWFAPDGSEVEEALSPTPIETYEQITSLVGDGRRHKGVDFKTPEGTPVVATFDGVVERRNWAFRGNGNCVDIRASKGDVNAYYLHLSAVDPRVKVGATVKKGQVLGRSGNTGRSTAPHLHYQLVRGKKVLDPFRFHQTRRARLPEGEVPQVAAAFDRLAVLRKQHDAASGL